MVNVLLISHGQLASGLLDAAQMIAGPQENVAAIGLMPEDSPESFAERVEATWGQMAGDETIFLVDLQGGTPGNMLALFHGRRPFHAIAGVNLAVVLEVLLGRNSMPVDDLAETARATGTMGLVDLVADFSERFGLPAQRNAQKEMESDV